MIAVDTNILVYAHREDSPHHQAALAALTELATSRSEWAIPWPCLHEFLAVVTHARVYDPPTTPALALEAVEALVTGASPRVLAETSDHLDLLAPLLRASGVRGAKVHDARIAAICLAHGVRELWSADRDFSYFPSLRVVNPLIRATQAGYPCA